MRRFLLFLMVVAVAVSAPAVLTAQDITGVWQGHFRSKGGEAMRSALFDDRYKFEVQIAQTDKRFQAVTYSYLSSLFYGKAAAAGTVNAHTGKVLLQEGKLLEVRNQAGDGVCIMTCFLQYSKSGDEEFLEGSYVSMNVRDSSNCGRGTVFLRKVASSDFYKEPFLVEKEKHLAHPPAGRDSAAIAKAAPPKRPATTGKPVTKPPVTGKPVATAHPPTTGNSVATTKPPVTGKPVAPAHPPVTGNPVATTKPVTRPKPVTEKPEKNPPPMAKLTMPHAAVRPTDSAGTGMSRHFATIPPPVLKTRSNQLVRTLTVNVNEVTLNIYDDGVIDHDTISIYLDNKQVVNHAMLTDRPLVLTLHLDESNDYHELVMVAENEGEIPPNTSLMIVKAGDKEYEVRITSTEQKNAVVQFKYQK
ncbi:hypothetical protein ACQ86N_16185 [Puia sp. P3]|uniref:hypothetical protein n=1 Tax=Puia sp. P3 TaxID=3423952 RepID=UPI003D66546F